MDGIVVPLLVLSLTALDRGIEARFIIDASPITECDNGVPFSNVDMTDFHIINRENGNMVYNGSLIFLKDYTSPIKRGSWEPGIIYREIADLCAAINNPLEPGVYKLTSGVETRCPIKAGHKEKFDMVEVGSWGVTLPPSFAGDWKVYIEMWITRGGRVDHECSLTPATIYEA